MVELMTRGAAINLLIGGPSGIAKWNKWRQENMGLHRHGPMVDPLPSLRDLKFNDINLDGAMLDFVDFSYSRINRSSFRFTRLFSTSFLDCNLENADLHGADLRKANLTNCNLSNADLRETKLNGSNLSNAHLAGANFTDAHFGGTRLCNLDLSIVHGLDRVQHSGPSSLGVDTIQNSRGQIPHSFLKGCGFSAWQILNSQLSNPALRASQFVELMYDMAEERNRGPLIMGGVFISYSHADSAVVDQLESSFEIHEVPVWRDIKSSVAGPLQRQIDDAIWTRNAVVLVLSNNSIASDWVMHEVATARRIEKESKRDILCPIAIDSAWTKKKHDLKWEHLMDKNILDFSGWQTFTYRRQFERLLKGLSIYYSVE